MKQGAVDRKSVQVWVGWYLLAKVCV